MKNFSKFTATYGSGIKVQVITEQELVPYKGFLPPELYELLINDGVSHYIDKFLWTLNPGHYIDWLNQWVQMDGTCIPFARTALGDILFVYNREIMLLLTNQGYLNYTVGESDLFFDRSMVDQYYLEKYFNYKLFKKLKNSGELEHDECYGFKPLLSLGGEVKYENLERVKMREYLLLVSQASDELTYYPY